MDYRVIISKLALGAIARFIAQNPHRSEEHTSELQSLRHLVCRLLLEKKKKTSKTRSFVHNTLPALARRRFDRSLEGLKADQLRGWCKSAIVACFSLGVFFFFNDTATTEIYTLSLHDALPISSTRPPRPGSRTRRSSCGRSWRRTDRKSTRLNSSHLGISYAVFCLKKKTQ